MMKQVLPTIVLTFLLAPLVSTAGNLEPCGRGSTEGYRSSVLATIDGPDQQNISVAFTSFPSFTPEWGLRVIDIGDETRLRTVRFQESVWYSAVTEVRPGYFVHDFSRSNYRRAIHETRLSADTAALLRAVVAREVQNARYRSSTTIGFDGTNYLFGFEGACAETWSPDPSSDAGRLVDIFEELGMQSSVPWWFLKIGLERRSHARLLGLEGKRMSTREFLFFTATALAMFAFIALPLLVATVFAMLRPPLPRRRWYVLVSAALSYGSSCLVALPFLLLMFLGEPIALQLTDEGRQALGTTTHWIREALIPAVMIAWLIASFLAPGLLRRHWRRLFTPAS